MQYSNFHRQSTITTDRLADRHINRTAAFSGIQILISEKWVRPSVRPPVPSLDANNSSLKPAEGFCDTQRYVGWWDFAWKAHSNQRDFIATIAVVDWLLAIVALVWGSLKTSLCPLFDASLRLVLKKEIGETTYVMINLLELHLGKPWKRIDCSIWV